MQAIKDYNMNWMNMISDFAESSLTECGIPIWTSYIQMAKGVQAFSSIVRCSGETICETPGNIYWLPSKIIWEFIRNILNFQGV